MILKESLCRAREALAAGDIDCAPLEGELLLRQALKLSRVQLYQGLEQRLAPQQEEAFWRLVKRRLNGEPTAYIAGHREFYGLDFLVSPSVLIPRPESELLVERTLSLTQKYKEPVIADIATGCGAIAISLAIALPQARLYASDISAPALEVALANCRRHGVASRVCLLHGDMLEPLPESVDLIVANLPYVKQSQLRAGGFEPLLALDGGRDGLERIRQLCRQVSNRLRSGGCLLLEMGQGQRRAVTTLLGNFLPAAEIEVTPDLGGVDRVLTAILPPVLKT